MGLSKFYETWRVMRILALAIATLIVVIASVRGHCHTLEIEYVGPGSEADRLNEASRDKDNKEAMDRVIDGSDDPDDQKGASDYFNDHSA